MLFTITGKHIEITDNIKTYAQDKAEKLPRYFSSIRKVDVVIEGKEGGNPCVEIIATAEHSSVFVAKETAEDVFACIDLALHKIESQLHRKKTKQRDNKYVSTPAEEPAAALEEQDKENIA